jgi:hypothetical protein
MINRGLSGQTVEGPLCPVGSGIFASAKIVWLLVGILYMLGGLSSWLWGFTSLGGRVLNRGRIVGKATTHHAEGVNLGHIRWHPDSHPSRDVCEKANGAMATSDRV